MAVDFSEPTPDGAEPRCNA